MVSLGCPKNLVDSEVMLGILARQGYEIATASNGAECLLAMEADRPDLLILDVTMPVLDGYRVLEVIRERPETSALPVIMLTAKREDEDVVRSLATGAELHLSKPFEMAELVAAARALLTARVADDAPEAGTATG